jgi:putative SOS response-associated peptidase YedK
VCAFDFWIKQVEKWEEQRHEWLKAIGMPAQPTTRINWPQKNREIIRLNEGTPEVVQASWGLVPYFADEEKRYVRKYSTYNARCETVDKLRSFKDSFQRRRCLLVGTAVGEWADGIEGRKQSVRFTVDDGQPYAYAGIWTEWRGGPNWEKEREKVVDLFGETERPYLLSCTMITCEPNPLVAQVHSRMPVILHEKDYAAWLDPEASPEQLKALLTAFPADRMQMEFVTLPPRGSKKRELHEAA